MPDSLSTTHTPEHGHTHVAPEPEPAAESPAGGAQPVAAVKKEKPKEAAAPTAEPVATADEATADTAAVVLPSAHALEARTCHEVDAPRILHLRNAKLGRPAYIQGIAPEPRAELPGYDSGVMTLLIVLFMVIASNFRHYSTFIKTFAQDLFTVRRRGNAFDETHTMSETRVTLSLITVVCVCEGILLHCAVARHGASTGAFAGITLMALLCGVYYACQTMAYNTVGYLFSDATDTRQWVRGFNASQSLLGIGLTIPALISLFNPGSAPQLLTVSIFLYGVARVIFITKGFRIFYDNYSSLIYFILYLCTLEIIPPIILYRLASYISLNF
ncbi:MAG: DUF4271 domain-containing protein [Bacteroides sp.]|nr:DUF4271 domain-containing protein [Bacteroides sp.]